MDLREFGALGACILLGACQGAPEPQQARSLGWYMDSAGPSKPQGSEATNEPDACSEDTPLTDPFSNETPTAPALLVQFGSRDTTARYESAVRVSRCGAAEGLVRRSRVDGAIELFPLPAGYVDALTGFDMSPDDRLIAYVEFGGDYGAHAVVRTFPGGDLIFRSRRLTVPGGDTVCGVVEFVDDSTVVAHVCADVPGFNRWVRLRGSFREGLVVEDTVEFGRGALQPALGVPPANGGW